MPVTYEEWTAQINSSKADSYPALMDGALRVGDAALRARVVEFLLVKWLDTDRGTYLQYLDQLEGSDDEGKDAWPILVPAFVKAVPQLNEQAASSPDLEEAVQWMTDYYAEQNPTAALDWAKKWLLGDAQESALATVAGQLSKSSLDQAIAVANGLKSPNARVDAMSNIGSELGKTDPQKALAWAQSLTNPAEKSAAIEEVMWSMADSDPAAAASQVKQINNPELLQNIGGTIAESLADKNPSQAMQWAEAIPAGAAQDEAVSGALSGWAKSDPKAAFDYLQAKHSTNGDAAENVFEQWATTKPEEAAAQATQISNPQMREQAVTGVVNGWLNDSDSQAVEQWVDGLQSGHEKDVASAALVDALSVNDPQPAWDRALTIKDTQVRQEAVLSAFSGLAQSDPEAAKTALKSSSISEADRKLLQPVLDSVQAAPKASN
ncbi:MAG TPA: hypothetical protein VNB29_07405 [Chthoniobacterales bacterium]|nr:hypothetical protein [Chthoniobacterales bacterium]